MKINEWKLVSVRCPLLISVVRHQHCHSCGSQVSVHVDCFQLRSVFLVSCYWFLCRFHLVGNTLCMISVLLYLLKFVLWSGTWSVLVSVPWSLEKKDCCTAIWWTVLSVSVNWILLQLVASLSSHTSLPVLCVVLPVCEWIFQPQLWLICDSCSLLLVVPHMPCTSVWCVLSVWPTYRKLCPSVSLIIFFAMTVIKALLRQCNVTSLCLWLWCYNIFGIVVPLSS